MLPRQQFFSFVTGFIIFLLIIYLIRQRKLREEYSWIWLLTGFIIFILIINYNLLLFLTDLIGAKVPTSALFFLSIIFLICINIFLSLKSSLLSKQIKDLTQEITILKEKISKQLKRK